MSYLVLEVKCVDTKEKAPASLVLFHFAAPAAGIEPATNRLTGDCSTAELHRNLAIITDMYVKVKIIAGARKELITKDSIDHYSISVKEKAENNNANRRLLEIMHGEYPNTIIRLISGHHSPSKILSIEEKGV